MKDYVAVCLLVVLYRRGSDTYLPAIFIWLFFLSFFPTTALNSELTEEVQLRKICTVSLRVLPVLGCYC